VFTALSGKSAIFKQMQVIANNLANMNTAGFKAEKILFEKALKQESVVEGSLSKEIASPNQLRPHDFVQIRGSIADLSQGAIETTHNPLDVAVDGEGMFVIQTPDGERYTRSGEFILNQEGTLVTQQGFSVMGQGGAITLGGGLAEIREDGRVYSNGVEVGQLRIAQVEAKDLIREAGQKFKLAEGASAQEVVNVKVRGGAVESSNVNAVKELTDMIFASRLFESMEKVNDSNTKMQQARNSVFGKPSA